MTSPSLPPRDPDDSSHGGWLPDGSYLTLDGPPLRHGEKSPSPAANAATAMNQDPSTTPSPPTKFTTSSSSGMLTISELERLRRVKHEQSDYRARAFAHLRTKPDPDE